MTILSAQTIRRLSFISNMIVPFTERGVVNGKSFGLSTNGYDIRLSKFLIDDEEKTGTVEMHPGDFLLASSIERFKMPIDVAGIVHDKSTWARLGLCVQNTIAEAGWEGWLTLELTNHHPTNILKLSSGDAIAQLVFHFLDQPSEQPYSGKYQDQPNYPVSAIDEHES